jgi:hypothetical protein
LPRRPFIKAIPFEYKMVESEFRTYYPQDGGPFYAETPVHIEPGQWLIEPWNAFSSLLIVAPAIYFLWQLRGRYKANLFLTLCIPLLIAGGMGSTLFHGLRIHTFFLRMDVFPTMLLFLAITAYFWAKALRSWWAAVGIMLLSFGLMWLGYQYLPMGMRVNVGYFLRGTLFFLPVMIVLLRTKFRHALWVFGSLAAFGAALGFRYADKLSTDVLPMGTHFLWHAATGLGGFLIAEYLLLSAKDARIHANFQRETMRVAQS